MPKSSLPAETVIADSLAAIHKASDALFRHTTKATTIDNAINRTSYYVYSIECNDLSVYDHNNRGYSRSRYELGNKCVIMTHCLIEIICCCCLIDRSQL